MYVLTSRRGSSRREQRIMWNHRLLKKTLKYMCNKTNMLKWAAFRYEKAVCIVKATRTAFFVICSRCSLMSLSCWEPQYFGTHLLIYCTWIPTRSRKRRHSSARYVIGMRPGGLCEFEPALISKSCSLALSKNIPCNLNEARVKLVSVFYHMQGIYPLRIGVFFVELHTSFFCLGELYCCGN